MIIATGLLVTVLSTKLFFFFCFFLLSPLHERFFRQYIDNGFLIHTGDI